MDDYADALGGVCEIKSSPGRGTRVEVRFPFDPGSSDEPGKSADVADAVAPDSPDSLASKNVRAEFAPGTGS